MYPTLCIFCCEPVPLALVPRSVKTLLPGSDGSPGLNDILIVYFITKQLLKLSDHKCLEIVEATRINSEIFQRMCGACEEIVDEAVECHQKILNLEEKIQVFGNSLLQIINESSNNSYSKNGDRTFKRIRKLITSTNPLFTSQEEGIIKVERNDDDFQGETCLDGDSDDDEFVIHLHPKRSKFFYKDKEKHDPDYDPNKEDRLSSISSLPKRKVKERTKVKSKRKYSVGKSKQKKIRNKLPTIKAKRWKRDVNSVHQDPTLDNDKTKIENSEDNEEWRPHPGDEDKEASSDASVLLRLKNKQTSVQLRNLIIKDWENRDSVPTSLRKLANKYRIHHSTLQYIVKKYKKTGKIENLPQSGRKRALNDRDLQLIREKIRANPFIGSKKIAEEIKKETGKQVTSHTILNYLRREGLLQETGQDKSEKFICDICGKTCQDKYKLHRHTELMHATGEFPCDLCNRKCKNQLSLDFHKKYHHETEKIQCHLCPKLFHKHALKLHIGRVHGSNKVKLQCQFCGKSYNRRQSLREHENVHRGGEKNF